jgi:hypothetical protein
MVETAQPAVRLGLFWLLPITLRQQLFAVVTDILDLLDEVGICCEPSTENWRSQEGRSCFYNGFTGHYTPESRMKLYAGVTDERGLLYAGVTDETVRRSHG